jgi:RNA polymerase sigma factor (TIGR02999 family)
MADVPAGQISRLLERIGAGDDVAAARAELLPLVYRDLEHIAAAYARRPGVSLEPRGLVHELYLKLAAGPFAARDRKHFYAVAALAMRQILADRGRRRRAAKRGAEPVQVTLSGIPDHRDAADAAAVDEALRQLEALSPRQARIVELRCLVGATAAEAAAALGISERTVHAEWRLARAWLARALTASATAVEGPG